MARPYTQLGIKVLDPCCGSGHFLVAAFALLRRFRMVEEGLSEAQAGDAVIRDNLFGLELDPRCTQIAVFALALSSWKSGGYRELPLPNVACTGLPVGANSYEFTHLADGDRDMEAILRRLHQVFRNAVDVGSLIDPMRISEEEGIFAIEWSKIGPLLEVALTTEQADDPAAAIFGATAKGVARAADFLTRQYHLVITNVPYLARGKQDAELRKHIEAFHNDAKADLATAFLDRCLRFSKNGGAVAVVTPQNWLFLGSYKALRERLIKTTTWNFTAKLGPQAFSTPMFDYNIAMFIVTRNAPAPSHHLLGIDVSSPRDLCGKAEYLRSGRIQTIAQADQLTNPDTRISFDENIGEETLLSRYATAFWGQGTGDFARFGCLFWEVGQVTADWELMQSTVRDTCDYGGRQYIVFWQSGKGELVELAEVLRERLKNIHYRGAEAWGKPGVSVSQMGQLPVTIYTGQIFDGNCAAIVPRDPADLPAIWCFCSSTEFHVAVRRIDQALKVTNASLVKVPFDLDRWQRVAVKQYPNGLPEPHSSDPTQWLFNGDPGHSTSPLHVSIARLLGYRWPQNDKGHLDGLSDQDGIVCLPPIASEPPAAQRLREVLAFAFASDWTPELEARLLAGTDYGGQSLDTWLRDGFFSQHCSLFQNRPFLWHIWDGRKDGFSAIVNYHKLDRAKLDRLIYTYIGDWINTQRHADSSGVAGANARMVAAITLQDKLKAIADGEAAPDRKSGLDIYVRWKPLHKQPIGWDPDLNDGVRMNIRPFVTAGVLRAKFSINWNKDRGTNPDGSERLNDLHMTRAEKEAARRAAQ